MRYVQVWVGCSREGCEAKAEHLVPVEIGVSPSSRIDRSIGDALPDGWSWMSSDPDHTPDVRETFCPAHAADSAPALPIPVHRDLSKHVSVVELVGELMVTITKEQIQSLMSRLTQSQLVLLMTVFEMV